MNTRRDFINKITTGTCGIAIGGLSPGFLYKKNLNIPGLDNIYPWDSTGVFPFYKYAEKYNIGDFIPKDQGGKFIQQELLGTEDDIVIAKRIRGGIIEKSWGDPIIWGKFEKEQLEKSVWLNRFYVLPCFARLYFLTGEKVHLDFMMHFIAKWIDENPHSANNCQSIYNWYDMQVAWRAIHLSWCFFLTSKGLSGKDKELIFNTLEEHAEILLSDFGRQELNEFNHQSHGALAMLYLGVLFPMLHNAEELVQIALKILGHHISHAFYADGGNVEQMFGYYPFEAHIFRDTYLLCKSNKVPLPENITVLLQKMAYFLSSVCQPDGTMPPVNDSFPMPSVPVLSTLSGALNFDITWEENRPAYFPDTQVGVLRASDSENSWYILANPAQVIGSHAHAGRLGFILWHNSQPFVVESGCCNYDDPMLVNWYRTSNAHNTALIDGKSDEQASESVQWVRRRKTGNRIVDWSENQSFCFCRMMSPGSEPANSSVTWYRNLAIIKNSFVIVYDYFSAEEEHNYEILFHLPDNVKVKEFLGSKGFLLKGAHDLAILPANEGNIYNKAIGDGYINKEGVNTFSKVVSYQLKGTEVHSVIVFSPVKESIPDIKIEQQISEKGLGILIEKGEGEKHIAIFRHQDSSPASFWGKEINDLFGVF